MSTPLVSVILPVYNGAADVPFAVKCILEQTFTDFELIAINDGSPRDNSLEILQKLKSESGDPRMTVIDMPKNVGLAAALNHGISLARGRYIARQDQDDLSRPARLEQQVRYMEANPACGLLGTRAEIWVGDEPTDRFHDHPCDNATLQYDLLFNNPFVHSSVLIRREALDKVGVYSTDKTRQPPEDYELWSRIARAYEVANLPERLLAYREVPQSMSRVAVNPFLDHIMIISPENISYVNNLAPDDHRSRDLAALIHSVYDRVSPQPVLDNLLAVLAGARRHFETRFPGQNFKEREAFYRTNLMHHFGLCTGLPAPMRRYGDVLRRLPIPHALKVAIKRLVIR